MKKTIFWSTLFTLIGAQVHADPSQPSTLPSSQPQNAVQMAPVSPPPPAGQNVPSVTPKVTPEPVINCDYKIPPETKKIEQSFVITWSEKAVTQAFNFDPNTIDVQLQKLQPCFTEQGWSGFNTALQKSGNLEAIKSQKLTVSSQIEGLVAVTEAKDQQWKINLPVQVVYQNEKEKVTQLLSVDLTVGRKMTGDLGITQMIAVPRGTVTQEQQTANTANTNPGLNNSGTTNPTTTPTNPGVTPSTSGSQTQPTLPGTPSATPTPATPGQPTLPENRSTQPSLPANTP